MWGIGLRTDDPRALIQRNWPGENKLGEALVDVRQQLKEEMFAKDAVPVKGIIQVTSKWDPSTRIPLKNITCDGRARGGGGMGGGKAAFLFSAATPLWWGMRTVAGHGLNMLLKELAESLGVMQGLIAGTPQIGL